MKLIADHELLSEAAWLKRLVLRELQTCDHASADRHEVVRAQDKRPSGRSQPSYGCSKPMLVRLRNEDRLLLDARAEARGMRPATYASVLLRSHLHKLAPLPKDELLTLKRSIGELAAIGRNINQIARAANEGRAMPNSAREEFRAMLKICEALRDSTKALLKANVTSWQTGYDETPV